jgi:hypothetical protein
MQKELIHERDGRPKTNTYGTGCQFLNPTFAPPVCPTSYVSRKSRSSGSVGSRPPFDLAYADRPSYDVSTGQCFATFIGTGPYSVRTYAFPRPNEHFAQPTQTC